MKKVKVLITGGKMPGFASIADALKKSTRYDVTILAGCWKPSISADSIADKTFPLGDNCTPLFIESVLNIIDKEKPDIIIPIRDMDLIPLVKNLKKIRELGCEPCLPTTSSNLIQIATNKFMLLEYLKNLIGMDVPKYYRVETSKDLESAVKKLGYPIRPVVVKPVFTSGSRGLRVIDETYNYSYHYFQDKPNNTYTSLKWLLGRLGKKFSPIIVTEYYPNEEYTIDVLCRKGQTFAIVPRLRQRMRDGITAEAVVTDCDLDVLIPICEKIVDGFGFSYNIGVQVKKDDAGIFQLLELNTRLQGTTCISVAAGVNIPEHMIAMALKEFDYDYIPEIKWGTQLERIYHEYYSYNEGVSRD